MLRECENDPRGTNLGYCSNLIEQDHSRVSAVPGISSELVFCCINYSLWLPVTDFVGVLIPRIWDHNPKDLRPCPESSCFWWCQFGIFRWAHSIAWARRLTTSIAQAWNSCLRQAGGWNSPRQVQESNSHQFATVELAIDLFEETSVQRWSDLWYPLIICYPLPPTNLPHLMVEQVMPQLREDGAFFTFGMCLCAILWCFPIWGPFVGCFHVKCLVGRCSSIPTTIQSEWILGGGATGRVPSCQDRRASLCELRRSASKNVEIVGVPSAASWNLKMIPKQLGYNDSWSVVESQAYKLAPIHTSTFEFLWLLSVWIYVKTPYRWGFMCSWREWSGLWLWSCAIKHSVDPSFEDYWRQHSKVKHGENIVAFPEPFSSRLHTMVMDGDGRALVAGVALVEVSILPKSKWNSRVRKFWLSCFEGAQKVHTCFIFVLSQCMFIFIEGGGGADVPPPPRSRAESQGCNCDAMPEKIWFQILYLNITPTSNLRQPVPTLTWLPRAMWHPKFTQS